MPGDDAAAREVGELISVRVAEHEDVDRIVAIAAEYDVSQLNDEASRSGGFLVSGFSKTDYDEFIDHADHFYVAEDAQDLVGFVLAYSSERIRSDEWLNKRLTGIHTDPFILIKQICVTRRRASRGVGSALYRTVFAHAGERSVLTVLVADPPNERSVTFHQRHGFHALMDLTPPDDGLPRSVWLRCPPVLETVRLQYTAAIELYRHEDSLNWSKLNNLFYVTGGLVAILGIAWEPANIDSSGFRALTVGVSIVGVLVAVAFGVALHWGVRYMEERKAAVKAVEERLLAAGAVPVTTRAHTQKLGGRQFERSPTSHMLRAMAPLFAVGWAVVGALAVTL